MKTFTILMDRSRYLTADSYILGVEGDHRIEKIALCLPRFWGETDILSSTVNLHLKAGSDYFYNAVPQDSSYNDDEVTYFFPVTREMTCKNEEVRIEFSFRGNGDTFSFTSRSLELMIATPLVEGEEIESDYPGILADTLNHVDTLQERLVNTEEKAELLVEELNGVDEIKSRVGNIEAFLGYDDEEIIGLCADFENNTFTRLAGAKGLSAGRDFNKFSIYRDRVRCNVADDGTITALYGSTTHGWIELAYKEGCVFAEQVSSGSGMRTGFPGDEPTLIPHPAQQGYPIRVTITNNTTGGTVTTFGSTLGVVGTQEKLGEFVSSGGDTVELRGYPTGTTNGSITESYSGYWNLQIYPYCTDDIDIKIELRDITGGYRDDGSNGQVMVYQPKFYYRVVPIKLEKQEDGLGYHIRKANYYISATPRHGFKLHPAFYDENGNPVEYILFSAYEGSMWDASAGRYVNDNVDESIAYASGDLMCSVSGVKPISGKLYGIGAKTLLEKMATDRGDGWHLETIKALSANQLLMIMELGKMNTQEEIGSGITSIPDRDGYNCSSLTGSTALLGNGSGSATETVNEIGGVKTVYNTAGKVSVSYRGVENPWGNIFKHIQGVNIWGDGTMCGGQPYIANDFDFNESRYGDNYEPVGFTLANADGYINAMGYGNEEFDWLLMPSEVGGTTAFPVGDYLYVAEDLNGYCVVRLGGSQSSGNASGYFFWRCDSGVGSRNRTIGGRLMFVPTAK